MNQKGKHKIQVKLTTEARRTAWLGQMINECEVMENLQAPKNIVISSKTHGLTNQK